MKEAKYLLVQSQNEQNARLMQPSQKSMEKDLQIQRLVAQSFDIFETYGREPEALANIFMAFREVLSECDIIDIRSAMNWWIRNERKMPLPADILNLAQNAKTQRELLLRRQVRLSKTPELKECKYEPPSGQWSDLSAKQQDEYIAYVRSKFPKDNSYLDILLTSKGVPKDQRHRFISN